MSFSSTIAIVGIGGIFPQSPSLDRFWSNIVNRTDTSSEPPEGRWIVPVDEAYAPEVGKADHVYSRKACFVEELGADLNWDSLHISRELLSELDPSFTILLHAGCRAFSDAKTEHLNRSRIGLVIGNLALPTDKTSELARQYLGKTLEEKFLPQAPPANGENVHPLNRYATGLPAGILASALGLGGGSYTLDAACASSLYAVKLACEELIAGRADAMLCGGLSRPDSLYTQMGFSQLHALSPTGTCAPFDRNGNGLVVGEGSGIFVLKRLDDAQRDGDRIHALIKGIGVSNDIGGSLLAPSSEGQLRAMRAAYEEAGWSPSDVDLIECHATGTPVGDAVEFSSLRTLWEDTSWDQGQCIIGSVKSNIGHLLTAAGSAALAKVLMAFREETLPPTANFSAPSSKVALDDSPFSILTQAQKWERRTPDTPRRAAVSAFGFGGINAHILIEEWIPEKAPCTDTAPHESSAAEPIAIVGLDARFGPWNSLKEFQHRVLGSDTGTPPQSPKHWWGIQNSTWYQNSPFKASDFKGFFLPEVQVRPGEFRIPPKELEEMLPRQLYMLQVAAGALRDAGITPDHNTRAGVFVGTGLDLNATNFSVRWSLASAAKRWARQSGENLSDAELAEWTQKLRDAAGPALSANRTMGALGSIVASRVAKEFRFGGPSFTLSAEDGSGLRALETAVRLLQTQTIDHALVGAVDFCGDPRNILSAHGVQGDSPESIVAGEGAAAVILKRLSDAQKDGDRIYAVLRGVGSSSALDLSDTSVKLHACEEALNRAYRDAAVPADSIGLLEAGASSVSSEKTLRLAALNGFFGSGHAAAQCAVTSTQRDIGHSGEACGIASLVKSALCLHHKILPSMRSHEDGAESQELKGSHFFAAPLSQYWLRNREDGPRRAAVTSISQDGNCQHVVLEEWESTPAEAGADRPTGLLPEGLFALEGDAPQSLQQQLQQLQKMVDSHPKLPIDTLARRWQHQRSPASSANCALALVAQNPEELVQQISFAEKHLATIPDHRLNGSADALRPAYARDRIFYSPAPLGKEGKVAFVYPGSGNHYPWMGAELSAMWPKVYDIQDAENARLRDQFQADRFRNGSPEEAILQDHNAMVMGQVALGTAVTDLIRSFGIRPQAAIGYSLGESASLFSNRVWQDRDGMLQRLKASPLFTRDMAGECHAVRKAWGLKENQQVDWSIGIVNAPAAAVKKALRNRKKVYLLIINTPGECVVGGDRAAVKRLVEKLDCHFIALHGITTVHCEVARPVAKPYRDLHLFPTTPLDDVTFYSGAAGASYKVTTDSTADAILAQAIDGIDYPKTIESAYADGARIFLEMGPGNSCTRMIGQILGDRPHMARAACAPNQPAASLVLRLLGQCIAERVSVDLNALYPQQTEETVAAPATQKITLRCGGKAFRIPERPSAAPKPAVISEAAVAKAPVEAPPRPLPATPQKVATVQPVKEESMQHPSTFSENTSAGSSLIQRMSEVETARTSAHEAYLRFADQMTQAMSQTLQQQMSLVQQAAERGEPITLQSAVEAPAPASQPASESAAPAAPVAPAQKVALDRDMCMEFAIGSIAKVLGPEFAEVDTYPTRVRLPDEPLMLVDRIVSIEGTPRSMTSGRVITEHDVTADRWYLDGDRIPTCVAVEAGQADLFLSGYLGIDFEAKGHAVYRLLDAVVTFHDALPKPGDTIRYDIRIDHFFRQDRTYLFRFNFEATVNGRPLISMKNGCAGFFTEAELAAGKGIVHTKLDLIPRPGIRPDDWQDLIPMGIESYNEEQINALRQGDLAGCFGPVFANLPIQNPMTLPSGLLKLVDRVTHIDPKGGRFSLGQIRAEADIHPEDWFLTCHFCDDNVMPGTLMYECCLHTLRIYLLRMGWIGEKGQVAYEPIPQVSSQLKCRGQVTATTKTVTYEVSLKEIGYRPEPYAIVDALMYADGKPIVEITNMTVRLSGLSREKIEALWSNAPQPVDKKKPALYDSDRILAFAIGNPSEAFGEPYRVFDSERKIARLPGPPFQFLDRVTAIDCEPWVLKAGGQVETQYDVPPDAWYFAANRQPEMPFSVLLEIGLQPCGWLAAYLGSALTSDKDLSFRNLDGNAVQLRPVTRESGTLTVRAKITRVANSGGMIIQGYDFEVLDKSGPVYTGNTVFGFFSKEALANQVGLRDVTPYLPSLEETQRGQAFAYPQQAPYPDTQMRMIDQIELYIPDGGSSGLGYIRGIKHVDPEEWFFKAHFYEDPVCPGSLGLESFLQLLKVAAVNRWGASAAAQIQAIAVNEKHQWSYRGQIIPSNTKVTVSADITTVDDDRKLIRANGFLQVDGKVIYQMTDFTVRLTVS